MTQTIVFFIVLVLTLAVFVIDFYQKRVQLLTKR